MIEQTGTGWNGTVNPRASVVECGSPLPLSPADPGCE